MDKQQPGVTLMRCNALALDLPDNSVDLVVTSPPYFGLRSYQDGGEHYDGQIGAEPTPAEFVDALVAATAEMVRVVKPSGSIWVNLGDKYAGSAGSSGYSDKSTLSGFTSANTKGRQMATVKPRRITTTAPAKSLIGVPWRYAIRCIDDLGLILRAEVIWSKRNGLPESVKDRVRRSHEQWFHFTLEPRYFSAVDAIREPHAPSTLARTGSRRSNVRAASGSGASGSANQAGKTYQDALHPLGKLPGSVWTIPTQPLKVPADLGVDHFAAFPMEWPTRIIAAWSPPGGVVLDPFGGTGTTAMCAEALGRHGISNDLSADYGRLAAWRTTDPKQRAKAAEKAAKYVPAPNSSRCGVLEALSGFMGEIRYEQELDNQEVAAESAALARDCELCYGECICPGGPQ